MKNSITLSNLIDWIRIFGVSIGYYFAFDAMAADESARAIRLVTVVLGLALCATSAFEGLYLSEGSALAKGFDSASPGPNPYHRQSALWFVAGAAMSLVVFVCFPESSSANVTYILFVLFFLALSAFNHCYEAVRQCNLSWQNINRPFLFLGLIAGTIPIIRGALL